MVVSVLSSMTSGVVANGTRWKLMCFSPLWVSSMDFGLEVDGVVVGIVVLTVVVVDLVVGWVDKGASIVGRDGMVRLQSDSNPLTHLLCVL